MHRPAEGGARRRAARSARPRTRGGACARAWRTRAARAGPPCRCARRARWWAGRARAGRPAGSPGKIGVRRSRRGLEREAQLHAALVVVDLEHAVAIAELEPGRADPDPVARGRRARSHPRCARSGTRVWVPSAIDPVTHAGGVAVGRPRARHEHARIDAVAARERGGEIPVHARAFAVGEDLRVRGRAPRARATSSASASLSLLPGYRGRSARALRPPPEPAAARGSRARRSSRAPPSRARGRGGPRSRRH